MEVAAVARDTLFCVKEAAVARDTLFCVEGAAVVRDTVSCAGESRDCLLQHRIGQATGLLMSVIVCYSPFSDIIPFATVRRIRGQYR